MKRRPQNTVLVLFFFLFLSTQTFANFGVGRSYVKDGVYFGDVQLRFKLQEQQIEALASGLTLQFQLNFPLLILETGE